MSEYERSYTNGEITVIWKAGISMDGPGTDRIAKQVDACPSGALSYSRNEKTSKAAE